MTPVQLQRILKCPMSRATKWADPLRKAMARYHITGPLQQAAFIAQIGHESGRLRYVKELWGPTPAQVRYEGRKDLGNTEPGDGFKFRGRGLIQVTGRANYAKCGEALGLDLLNDPKLLEVPDIAAMSAGWFWHANNCNSLVSDFVALTKRINGGTNGLPDRLVLFASAREVLNA